MPSLNITFTDEEHAQLQEAAKRAGKALKPFAHDVVVDATSDYRRAVLEAAHRAAVWSAELNQRLK
ncbi:antitoxin Phd [Gordonia sp. TBRC 11910]|uniref:Antitoxin Phd n=1 Tax=Gordonia asplenii TaxID=2725283 RepID=A0A848KTX6_9ACTN|nr:antitoxin Phd [Gordonia asplenii]NMO01950.1 antitoxin Phd [Gordonia asplenii]